MMFLKKGDKVRLHEFKWFEERMDIDGDIKCEHSGIYIHIDIMKKCAGKIFTVDTACDDYTFTIDGLDYWLGVGFIDKVIANQTDKNNKPNTPIKQTACKYKRGDKVRVISKETYERMCDSDGFIMGKVFNFTPAMAERFLGSIVIIENVRDGYYNATHPDYGSTCYWVDQFFEGPIAPYPEEEKATEDKAEEKIVEPCSECGKQSYYYEFGDFIKTSNKYCPSCGLSMVDYYKLKKK